MKVLRVFRFVNAVLIPNIDPLYVAVLIPDVQLPKTAENSPGKVIDLLMKLRPLEGYPEQLWAIEIALNDGPVPQRLYMPFNAFLTTSEYEKSQVLPVCFSELFVVQASLNIVEDGPTQSANRALAGWLWLFRDGIYSTDEPPWLHESEEVILRLKSLHFQRDERLRRLREQVANFEAIETNLGKDKTRRPLPDDVKLLVWSRDGGACAKCGSQSDLHFDHIIAFARGGSDEAENIQLLCRSCNLSKSDRLT